MNKNEIQEGLGELADRAERDHEVQMARSDLYKIAKYAIKLHDMLKGVSEAEGLEGWVQSKITKSADYLGSVYHHLDYEEATGELGEGKFKSAAHRKAVHAAKASGKRSKKKLRAGAYESDYKSDLHAKLAEKKEEADESASSVVTKKIAPKNIQSKKISPNKGGN